MTIGHFHYCSLWPNVTFMLKRLTTVQGQSSEDRGAAKRLSEAYQEREAELNEMKSRLEEAEEKKRAAQSTLDAAYKLVHAMQFYAKRVVEHHNAPLFKQYNV